MTRNHFCCRCHKTTSWLILPGKVDGKPLLTCTGCGTTASPNVSAPALSSLSDTRLFSHN